ncbi:MAG: hypothetical protein V4576_03560 [Patescibacteria group bacterium]
MNNDKTNVNNTEVIPSTASLHTLEGDLLASMKDENYSSNIVKIVTSGAGNKSAGPASSDTETSGSGLKKYMFIFIGIILIAGVGAGIFYAKNLSNKGSITDNTATTTPATPLTNTTPFTQAPSIFDADVVIPIKVANTNKVGLVSAVKAVKEDLLANKITNKTNITLVTDVSVEDFFNKIQYSGPQSIIRSLAADKAYNFGIYHTASSEFETYLLIKVDTFDLAFSGMLDWERGLPIDLQPLFTYTPVATPTSSQNQPVGTTTAATSSTTTVSVPEIPYAGSNLLGKFSDKVVKNIDTRVYTDPQRGVQIMYGFINKKYLLITSGENSFVDVMNKLLVKSVLR